MFTVNQGFLVAFVSLWEIVLKLIHYLDVDSASV